LGTLSSMTVTIADDATEPPTNIIDDAKHGSCECIITTFSIVKEISRGWISGPAK